MHSINIRSPQTQSEWDQYYNLRWRILREPWNQPEGSEKDDIEDECVHVIATSDNNVIGIGRLQFNSDTETQIRYMAVEPEYENQGVGKYIVNTLEEHAIKHNYKKIMLDARETAVGFYEKLGYVKKEKTYLLFNSIQHFRMQKTL